MLLVRIVLGAALCAGCQPRLVCTEGVLTSSPGASIFDLGEHTESNLYWSNQQGEVWRTDSCYPRQAQRVGQFGPGLRQPLRSSGTIYGFVEGLSGGGRIVAMDSDGAVRDVAAIDRPAGAMVVVADTIYWTQANTDGSASIQRVSTAGGSPSELVALASLPVALEASASSLYVSSPNGIDAVSFAGTVSSFISGRASAITHLSSGRGFFWTEDGSSQLFHAYNGGAISVVSSNAASVSVLEANRKRSGAAWIDEAGTIRHVDLAEIGNPREKVISDGAGASSVLLVDDVVYWVDADGNVRRTQLR